MNTQPIDITDKNDTQAENLLLGHGLTVRTAAGRIWADATGLWLQLEGKRRPKHFPTTRGPLKRLRKATVQSGASQSGASGRSPTMPPG